MSIYKQAKDQVIRLVLGKEAAPAGLVELNHYFRFYGPINFRNEKQEDGSVVAVSQNFRYGSIITRADRPEDLDEKVKDAILTAFEVPSSYAAKASVHRVGAKEANLGRAEEMGKDFEGIVSTVSVEYVIEPERKRTAF